MNRNLFFLSGDYGEHLAVVSEARGESGSMMKKTIFGRTLFSLFMNPLMTSSRLGKDYLCS
jgi:hypothetical protein